MRDILLVITDIRSILIRNNHCTQENSKARVFFQDINQLYDSLYYKAPEVINSKENFLLLQDIMNFHINQDDYINFNWCKDVIDIFLCPNYGNE
jgi:hypothetical protein